MPLHPAPAAFHAELAALGTRLTAGLDCEIAAVLRDLERWGVAEPVVTKSAEEIEIRGRTTLYRVRLARPVKVPGETPVMIHMGRLQHRATTVQVSERGHTVVLSVEGGLPRPPHPADLNFDPSQLLVELRSRLEDICAGERGWNAVLPAALFRPALRLPAPDSATAPSDPATHDLNADQLVAVGLSASVPLSFCFGPPGTGKTRTLGALALELARQRGERVLITAHTNAAVDIALCRIAEEAPDLVARGEIIRVGEAGHRLGTVGLTLEETTDRLIREGQFGLASQLASQERQLLACIARLPATHRKALRYRPDATAGFRARLASAEACLTALEQRLDDEPLLASVNEELGRLTRESTTAADRVLGAARITAATLTKLAVSQQVYGRRWEAVIVDEASMATPPQVALAAALARHRIAVFGDPRQLPPVVQSNAPPAREQLGRDVFHHAGVASPEIDVPHRSFLSVQYRMAPAIRDLVSQTFYAGRLRDGPGVGPRGASSLALVDTSRIDSQVQRRGGSRANPVHAALVAELTHSFQREGYKDIGIVSPFRAQVREIRNALGRRGLAPSSIDVGTVHRFQGGERDVVLFDTTDTPPFGRFLDSRRNSDLARLINVALSRARHRLVFIAHARGFRNTFAEHALMPQILFGCMKLGRYYEAGALLEDPRPLTRHHELARLL